MTLDTALTELKGVGEAQAKKFALLGLSSVGNLIDYYPRRYEDYSMITPINILRPGAISIEATVQHATGRYVRRGMHITEAVASDDSGSVRLLWFNQPYRAASFKPHQKYFISGQYELSHQHLTIMNPSVELASDFPVNTARIIPVYRETKGLTSRQIRLALKSALSCIRDLPESLPGWIITSHMLVSRAEALEAVHFPDSAKQLEAARHRLGFE